MIEADRPARAAPPHPLPAALMHDLRTPLNHIIGYSEMMIEQAEEENAGLVPHLEKVRAAGYHLLALLDDNFVVDRAAEAEEPSRGADAP